MSSCYIKKSKHLHKENPQTCLTNVLTGRKTGAKSVHTSTVMNTGNQTDKHTHLQIKEEKILRSETHAPTLTSITGK